MGSSLVGSGGGCSRYVSQQTRCLTSTGAIRLIRDGEKGGGGGYVRRGGGGGDLVWSEMGVAHFT